MKQDEELAALRAENAKLREEGERADTLLAAINHALSYDDRFEGMLWLQDWSEGDPDAMRELEDVRAALGGENA